MSVVLRKVTYVIHLDHQDDDGQIIGELTTGDTPLWLYPHQLADLPDRIAGVIAEAEAKLRESES